MIPITKDREKLALIEECDEKREELEELIEDWLDENHERGLKAWMSSNPEVLELQAWIAKHSNDNDIARFDKWIKTPRQITDELVELFGKAPLFGKRKWEDKIQNSPLVYAKIIQANYSLYDIDPGKRYAAPAVILYAEEPKYQRDIEWLDKTVEKIQWLKDAVRAYTDDEELDLDDFRDEETSMDISTADYKCSISYEEAEFINLLIDAHTDFFLDLPDSLTGGVEAYAGVVLLRQAVLPDGYVPSHEILPFFSITQSKQNPEGLIYIH